MSTGESATFYMRAMLCLDYGLKFLEANERRDRIEQEFWRTMHRLAYADFRALPQHSSQKAGGVL